MEVNEDLLTYANLNINSIDKTIHEKYNVPLIDKILCACTVDYRIPQDSFFKLHKPQYLGYTLLHVAVHNSNILDVKYLLDRGANFTIQGCNSFTALRLAIEVSYGQNVNCLANPILDKHVETKNSNNPASKDGISHFHIACMVNHIGAVKLFLKKGTSVNEPVKMKESRYSYGIQAKYLINYTPLHIAARHRNIEIMKILLDHGANKSAVNDKGMTALQLILERKMKINEILCRATVAGDSELIVDLGKLDEAISLLTSHVSSMLEPIDDFGLTQLHLSCFDSDNKLGDSQLKDVKNINPVIAIFSPIWSGWTPLHVAAHYNIEAFITLLKFGANICADDGGRLTPLDICLEKYELKDILKILSSDENLKNIKFSDGSKLVDVISYMFSSDVFETFLQSRAKLNITIQGNSLIWPGYTLLHLAFLFATKKGEINLLSVYNELGYDSFNYNINENKIVGGAIVKFKKNARTCWRYNIDFTIQDVSGMTVLHHATCLSDMLIVKYILDHHESKIINPTSPDGLSHFHIALMAGNVEMVEKFINSGVDINSIVDCHCELKRQNNSSKDIGYLLNTGLLPLNISMYNGDIKMTTLLLNNGADPLLRNADGLTALHFVFTRTGLQLIHLLLSNSKVLEENTTAENGLSNFYIACCTDNVDAINHYLKLGADVNGYPICSKSHRDEYSFLLEYYGCTPLHFAANNEKMKHAGKILLANGANIYAKNPIGLTPLALALIKYVDQNMHLVDELVMSETFKSLLDHVFNEFHCDRNRYNDNFDITLLHVASATLHTEVVEKILQFGDYINAQVSTKSPIFARFTALHFLVCLPHAYESIKPILELLLKHGADVSITALDNQTAIHLAYARMHRGRTLDMLLKHQKDYSINPTDNDGLSHLHIACTRNDVEVVESFLKSRVNVNQKTYFFKSQGGNFTPLFYAVAKNCTDVFHLLLRYEADTTTRDSDGNTLIHHAIEYYNPNSHKNDILKTLLRMDNLSHLINTQNKYGEYPLHKLIMNFNRRGWHELTYSDNEVVELLMARGTSLNEYYHEAGEKGLFGMTFLLIDDSYLEIFEKIVSAAQDVCSVDESSGCSLIHNLVFTNCVYDGRSEVEYAHIIGSLLQRGCELDRQNFTGKTALHLAAINKLHTSLSGLLMQGADMDVIDHDGKSPYQYCEQLEAEHPVVAKLSWHVYKMMLVKIDVSQTHQRLCQKLYPSSKEMKRPERMREVRKPKEWTDESCIEELGRMGRVRVYKNLTLRDLLR